MRRTLARWNRSPATNERGSIVLFAAIVLVAVLGFTGLVMDYGQATVRERFAQNAADAAAQGAAYEIYAGATEASATTTGDLVVQKHGYPTSDLTALNFLDSSGNPTSTASDVQYVQSKVSETFPTFLLGILGIRTASVSATATTKVGSGTSACALCLLSSSQGLATSGGDNITVTNGNIWIDDTNGGAITASGTNSLTAAETGVVASGSGAVVISGSTTFTPAATVGAPPVADPLKNVPPPSVTSTGTVASGCGTNPMPTPGRLIASIGSGTCTINPGVYSGMTLSGSGTLVFTPGIYVFTGGVTISGSWDFSGNDVMLYLTCSGYTSTNTQPCNGSSGAGLTWSGTTTYQLTAPTSGTYKGLAIFSDRTNTAGITLSGAPSDNFTGTVYAADSAGTMSGTFGANQLNSMVILSHLTVSGSTTVNLQFDQSQNYSSPQLPVFTQ